MKTIILAGGLGTRLSEETQARPKPMVEIGGHPMLWHIMKTYRAHGFDEFVVALGYKGEVVKNYFSKFFTLKNDLTVDLATGATTVHGSQVSREKVDWKVHLVDTGLHTMTGGRLARLRSWVAGETFMATYGDGLSDVDLSALLAFHKRHGKIATVTAVRPAARFGALVFDGDRVDHFSEKPQTGEGWINGGFFVLEARALDFIADDQTIWEREPMERLAAEGQLMAFRHSGFWQPMDTLREKHYLEAQWSAGKAAWKVW